MSATMTPPPSTDDTDAVSGQIEEQVDKLGADVVLGEIKRSCYLIYVTIRAWAGQYVIQGANVEVDGRGLDETITTAPRWKLMPDSWHKRVRPFEGKIRKAIRAVAVPFKDGVYLVPKKRARDLINDIRRIRAEYKAEVERLVEEWPNEVRRLEDRIIADAGPEQWMAVSKMIPDASRLGSLYDVEIGLWPGGHDGLPVECVDHIDTIGTCLDEIDGLVARLTGPRSGHTLTAPQAEALARVAVAGRLLVDTVNRSSGRILEEHVEDWVGEAQSTTNRLVSRAVENMINEPIREFENAVGKLAEMQGRGTCRLATLDVVRRAYNKLKGFEFLMPEELMQRLKDVDVRIGSMDPQAVNGGSVAAQQLSESLRAITDELVSDATKIKAFSRIEQFDRSIDI